MKLYRVKNMLYLEEDSIILNIVKKENEVKAHDEYVRIRNIIIKEVLRA